MFRWQLFPQGGSHLHLLLEAALQQVQGGRCVLLTDRSGGSLKIWSCQLSCNRLTIRFGSVQRGGSACLEPEAKL
jgi:hypothetical protein